LVVHLFPFLLLPLLVVMLFSFSEASFFTLPFSPSEGISHWQGGSRVL
jgi:ABC-type spermidine/putrescine transport system permease subunit II